MREGSKESNLMSIFLLASRWTVEKREREREDEERNRMKKSKEKVKHKKKIQHLLTLRTLALDKDLARNDVTVAMASARAEHGMEGTDSAIRQSSVVARLLVRWPAHNEEEMDQDKATAAQPTNRKEDRRETAEDCATR